VYIDLELALRARAFEPSELFPIGASCGTKERHRLMGRAASPNFRRWGLLRDW